MPLFIRLKTPIVIAGRFDAENQLSEDQRMDILQCRVVLATGWSWEYVESLSIEVIGKIISYQDGMALLERLAARSRR